MCEVTVGTGLRNTDLLDRRRLREILVDGGTKAVAWFITTSEGLRFD